MDPNRRQFLTSSATAVGAVFSVAHAVLNAEPKKPNIVIVLLDDSGYSDFRPFGKPDYATPNVARLARQGCTFTNFHVPQAVCSASRSALLSGCYPGRTGVVGAHPPGARGLEPKFATMGEVLKGAGYRTAVFGKWHIGDQPETRPPARGFDESCGLMYSNDMWEFHPQNPNAYKEFPLHFWENGQVKIERITPELQPNLTTWYTEHAVDFIRRNRNNPFLLYVPQSMPHVPLFCSEKFKGKSGAGLYGDVMMEIDWSVGEIEKALQSAGVAERTLVIFSSDNGPWLSYGNHAGKTPFREGKMTGFDGGTRSACIVRYPGQIKAGSTSKTMFCSVDLLPTIARLTGAPPPRNAIDGLNVWDLIRGQRGAANPHTFYPFSTGRTLEGVFSADGRWKLHLPHPYQSLVEAGRDGNPGKYRQARIELSLFDMEADPLETTNVIERYPEVATRLQGCAEEQRREFYS
ncbi:MAG: sulfatase [Acidobacteriia bacterium]|nr:sulfatase [Terriglobia bacterium]